MQKPAKQTIGCSIGLNTNADLGEKQELFEGTPGCHARTSARVRKQIE